ncbi:hypothetical protein ACTFIZ_002962 [Dictyostelium cf. discoideum]
MHIKRKHSSELEDEKYHKNLENDFGYCDDSSNHDNQNENIYQGNNEDSEKEDFNSDIEYLDIENKDNDETEEENNLEISFEKVKSYKEDLFKSGDSNQINDYCLFFFRKYLENGGIKNRFKIIDNKTNQNQKNFTSIETLVSQFKKTVKYKYPVEPIKYELEFNNKQGVPFKKTICYNEILECIVSLIKIPHIRNNLKLETLFLDTNNEEKIKFNQINIGIFSDSYPKGKAASSNIINFTLEDFCDDDLKRYFIFPLACIKNDHEVKLTDQINFQKVLDIIFNFCTLNSLDPSNITLVVFMDYLTHLFKIKPPLAFSIINNHRSMLNQLLLLRNQTDIVNDPFISRIMTGIHKLCPSSAKYKEIWDANKVFKYLSTIKVLPKFTYTALLNKTLVLCKIFGLARSSDLVKWSFKGLNITTDSIRGPVINAKEQRKDDDTYSQVCPVRHLTTYLKSTKERRKKHQSDSIFINNDGTPLQVNQINEVVLSTLSKSGIDTTKFKSHSTRSAMASLLLSNNFPFHVVKKIGRWKSNDTVDTFYDKRIIGEKSGGFLNNVVQIS